MKTDQKIIDKLQELIDLGEQVVALRKQQGNVLRTGFSANYLSLAGQWEVSSLNLLGRVFGKNSVYYTRFKPAPNAINTQLNESVGILRSAKIEYVEGFLFNVKSLVRAEVFDDFLEQADHLWQNSYFGAAAVIAGCVLEDNIRQLCQLNNIALAPKPKLDTMNANLAKAGVYNLLVQKKITALADLRNKAAHGKWTEFNANDVQQMIIQVRSFAEDYLP